MVLSANRSLINSIGKAFLFIAVYYLGFAFPFAYFRHDDWFILGNSVLRLDEDWSFLFRPTLFSFDVEHVWFFRPLFKLFVYVFYKLFHDQYFLWLSVLLLFLLGSVWYGARSIQIICRQRKPSFVLVVLFCSTVPIHFGSAVWMGEGMMNCPQIFFLSLSLYLFLRSSITASLIVYLLSLGFKEAGVFHLPFLISIVLFENIYANNNFKKKVILLLPFVLTTGIYLVIRLFVMPLNPQYVSSFSFENIGQVLLIMGGVLLMPVLITWIIHKRRNIFLKDLSSKWYYFLCIGASLGPYLGHAFFSPGWLLFPGFYMIFVIALVTKAKDIDTIKIGAILFILSNAIIGWKLVDIGWWKWNIAQREMHAIIRQADENKTKALVILTCPNPKYPTSNVERVVGARESLYELWKLEHKKPIPIFILGCDMDRKELSDGTRLVLRWEFPHFQILSNP